MKVEIFTITFNSMYIMPFFIEHYRERFPDAVINVYDDGSSDNTTSYCRNMGCNVVDIPQPSDCLTSEERTRLNKGVIDYPNKIVNHSKKINDLRNNCWRNSTADWVIVVDHDELVDICEKDLDDIEGYDIIVFAGYNMYNETSNPDIDLRKLKFAIDKTYDSDSHLYNKPLMIKKNTKINITDGGHDIVTPEGLNLHNLSGKLKISEMKYRMYHYPKRMLSKENFFNHFRFYISLPEHEYMPQIEKFYLDFTTNIKLVEIR